MSSVILTFGNIRSIAEAMIAKGHTDDSSTIKIIDVGSELIVRDINDLLLTSIKKIVVHTEQQDYLDH